MSVGYFGGENAGRCGQTYVGKTRNVHATREQLTAEELGEERAASVGQALNVNRVSAAGTGLHAPKDDAARTVASA